jgi:hypothetical protein
VDGDGRLDYAVDNQRETSWFFHNASPHPGAFMGLRVVRGEGVPVIGASATVHLPDGSSLKSQSDGGSGHSGKRSPEIHFGVGNVPWDRLLAVEIRWRHRQGIGLMRKMLKPGWHMVNIEGN